MAIITESERREASLRRRGNADFDRVLAIMWLRLSNIYMFEGNEEESEQAMSRAIYYFDLAGFENDPNYRKNKRKELRRFIEMLEEPNLPQWKRQTPASDRERDTPTSP